MYEKTDGLVCLHAVLEDVNLQIFELCSADLFFILRGY